MLAFFIEIFFGDAAAFFGALRPKRLRVYILKNIFLDKRSYKNIFLKYFFSKKRKKPAYYGNIQKTHFKKLYKKRFLMCPIRKEKYGLVTQRLFWGAAPLTVKSLYFEKFFP